MRTATRSTTVKKVLTRWRPMILSRHPSHSVLRLKTGNLPLLPVKSCVRFGSTTDHPDTVSNGGNRIEINTIQSIRNSANKLLMKGCFERAGVKTAEWFSATSLDDLLTKTRTLTNNWETKLVAKAHFGSKGRGNTLISNEEELRSWFSNKELNLTSYLFEKFMNYGHEFRFHVTADGIFYACRKALKQDVPEDQKWRRHDDICVWFLEENPSFFKPNSWDAIERDCVNALREIGADILSFDVRVQTPTTREGRSRETQDYILLECNSASSMDNGTGEISVCARKYMEILPQLILKKANLR